MEELAKKFPHLTCPFCKSILTEPRRLDCSHSFCSLCLHEIAKQDGYSSVSCPVCQTVTQLDAIGLFSLPHDLAKRDEIRRVRDNELSLALPMKEFQPFFDKSEANQAKTSGKKGGEEKTEEPPSLPSTDSPASPTLIRSPSPSSSSSSTSKSNSGSSSTNLTGSFQGFVYYPKLQAPPPSKEEIIQPTPSLASQPLYTSQISLPPSVSSSFFSAFSTLHPSHPEKSLEDGWVDIRGSADVYFEKEWKDWKDVKKSRLCLEILDAVGLMGTASTCDPYVIITQPRKRFVRERLPYQPSTSAPGWFDYYFFDFDAVSNPPPKMLILEVWNANYLYDELLGRVEIPFEILFRTSAVDRWFALIHPYGGVGDRAGLENEKVGEAGLIRLKLHFRKMYDGTSEAAEEIRLINDLCLQELPFIEKDKKIMSDHDSASHEYYSAQKRLKMRMDKREKFEKMKQNLLRSTLLKLPLTPFEVEDISVAKSGSLGKDEQFKRITKYEELIKKAEEDVKSYELHKDQDEKAIQERYEEAKLRLEYLLFYLHSMTLPNE